MKSGNQAMVISQLLETAYPAGWKGHMPLGFGLECSMT